MSSKKQKEAGAKGREEGHAYEQDVIESIDDETSNDIAVIQPEQMVESAVSENGTTTNKSDIEVSCNKTGQTVGISVKNPKKSRDSIQTQIVAKKNLLARLKEIKEASRCVRVFSNLFFGEVGQGKFKENCFKENCGKFGVDYDSLDPRWEQKRDRAYWDSIPLKYREAFLDYLNDSEVKKETLETVIKKGVTTLPGSDIMLWCDSSVSGKGSLRHTVAFDIDKLVESICKHEWRPYYSKPKSYSYEEEGEKKEEKQKNGRWDVTVEKVKVTKVKVSYPEDAQECTVLHLGPITLQMKGSGREKSPAAYHSMQFNTSLEALRSHCESHCPEAMIHEGDVPGLARHIESNFKEKHPSPSKQRKSIDPSTCGPVPMLL